jgi:Fe-S oxidoreductase
MTTYQITTQAEAAVHSYAQGYYIDAFDAACCAAFLAYYGRFAPPDGAEVYHRVCQIRSICRLKLSDLLRERRTPTP